MCSSGSDTLGLWGGESEDIIKRDFPIHRACRDGDHESLRRLRAIATREQFVAEDKFYGWTPIHWAAYFGNIDCLNELLSYGISANLCTSKFRQTPCHIASFGGHPRCLLRLLKSGANFHAQDYLGETPIHKASRVGNLESINVLLANGSRLNLCNNNGHLPSDLARMQGFWECVNSLELPVSQSRSLVAANCGSSGVPLNGLICNLGAQKENCSRKRMFADESIPNHKRCKIEDAYLLGKRDGDFKHVNGNGVLAHSEEPEDSMDVELPVNGGGVGNTICDAQQEVFQRAPSPGMDINIFPSSDMQLWGHYNGYGDTAETMPSPPKHKPSLKNGYDRSTCVAFRGIQSRGWH